MSKSRKIFIVVILFVTATSVGVACGTGSTGDRPVRKDEIVLFGNVDIRQVNPAFNVSECVLRIAVEEGSRVVKGQLLASLDSERLQYEVDRAQARVQAQQELVSKMETGSRPDEIDKARAEANAVCGLLSKSYNFMQPPSKISTC